MAFEEKYMRLAIALAKKGEGAVNPNPLVGAVIVKDGRIIGEGYHARYGELHAERDAFSHLTESAEGAEMYVTLEPCCHYGKQPPCVEAIVEHKIKKVYIGSDDPNPLVEGKGVSYLREQGVEVETGKLKAECDDLNSVFFHYITTKTPYVVMKYAMSMDGKIAAYTGASKWITGESARKRVQMSRNKYMGIMVGIGTVLADDPMLTCRIEGGRNPIRIVCDGDARIPLDSNLVKTAQDVPTIVAVREDGPTVGTMQEDEFGMQENEADKKKKRERITALKEKGVIVIQVPPSDGHLDLKVLMKILGEKGIDSILLEGGGTLNYSAIDAGIVNEVHAYIAPKMLGGRDALTPVEGQGVKAPDLATEFTLKSTEQIGQDILLTYQKIPAKRQGEEA